MLLNLVESIESLHNILVVVHLRVSIATAIIALVAFKINLIQLILSLRFILINSSDCLYLIFNMDVVKQTRYV